MCTHRDGPQIPLQVSVHPSQRSCRDGGPGQRGRANLGSGRHPPGPGTGMVTHTSWQHHLTPAKHPFPTSPEVLPGLETSPNAARRDRGPDPPVLPAHSARPPDPHQECTTHRSGTGDPHRPAPLLHTRSHPRGGALKCPETLGQEGIVEV